MADDHVGGDKVHLPAVSLPKGGGALRGIGEKVAVNPTGSATFSVPLPFSAARTPAGTPQLGLAYDSGAGNGPFGLGWTLSLPSIARKTEKRLPRYLDGEDSDLFVLAGAEDLVPSLVEDQGAWIRDRTFRNGFRIDRYRPRVEAGFARIERWTDVTSGDAYWRTLSTDNVTSFYGRSANARIADPADARRIYKWLLEETRDDKGNIVAYEYKPEDTVGVDTSRTAERNRLAAAGANRYPKRVSWGNQTPEVAGAWCFELVFDYGEHDDTAPSMDEVRPWSVRTDPFSSYRPGFEVRTWRLCRRVLLFHVFDALGAAPQLVRSLELQHAETPVVTTVTALVHSGYTFDGAHYTKKSLPPIELAYTTPAAAPQLVVLDPASAANAPAGIGGSYQWVDLDSEGMSGLLTEQAQGWYYKRNLGNGELGEVELVARKPRSGLRKDAQLLDLGNDGHKYLVELGGELPGYYQREDDPAGWSPFVPFTALPNLDWKSPFQRLIDLDGDGLADVLVTEDDAWSWYPSLGTEGFGACEPIALERDEERGPVLVFSDPTQSIFLADLSGDGLVDLVRVRNGEVCYWANLGFGRFGAKVTMSDAPVFDSPEQFDPRRIRFADVDGTGASDLIYLGRGTATYWNNEAGNGWTAGRVFDQLPRIDSIATATALDFLGNGTSCIVWSSSAPRDAGRPLAYLDLMGGQKPYLLASVRNNLGTETTINYAPSTRFYVDDRTAGTPWVTRVPFPVQVVERFEKHDLVTGSRFASTFTYHHGYYDGPEQEFRGFARVDQVDTEVYADPQVDVAPVLTRTWYHTGAFCEGERIAAQLATEYWKGDADPQAALLADTMLPVGLTTPEQLEACRALKGLVLRKEIYALDKTALATTPYSVSERSYALRLVQPRATNPYAVLTSLPREALDFQYERTADPRVSHSITLAIDAFNNVLQSVTIAYPRRGVAPFPEQGQVAITLAESDVVNVVEQPDDYRIGVPLAKRSYELVPASPVPERYQVAELVAMLPGLTDIPYEAPRAPGTRRLLGRAYSLYYLDDLSGSAAYGTVGRRALVYRSYQQILTPGAVTALWSGRVAAPDLTAARYELSDGVWWLPSGRMEFDATRFFIPVRMIDLFGNTASVTYDPYALLVVQTDSSDDPVLDNIVTVTNDYRTLTPSQITDANGNRAAVRTDELGLVIASAVMGKANGPAEGDTLDDPTVKREYDFSVIPVYVHTSEREQHGTANQRWLEGYEFSDGFGRVVQKKIQAEPDPQTQAARWIGSGRMVFNNKGNAIKQYEPFFTATAAYEDEAAVVATGVTPILHYDPIGRVVRTDHADGSISRVEFDAWQTTTYDRNDTVLDSPWYQVHAAASAPAEDRRAAQLAAAHAHTPGIAHYDPLGRTFLVIADNGPAGQYHARTVLDIQGRTVVTEDHFDRAVMTFGYDMLGNRVYQHGMDSGTRWTLTDAGGQLARSWDSRGHVRQLVYDQVRRPTHAYLATDGGAPILVERTVYGERVAGARDANLIGKMYRHYDGAGVASVYGFDFKGNQLTGERSLARNFQTTVDWSALAPLVDPVDIENAAAPSLELDKFTVGKTYDALNRVTQLVTPDGSITSPGYNQVRLLETVTVSVRGGAPAILVSNIDYDAKGQRQRIAYGAAVVTTYTYDRATFRLTGLVTVRANDGARLQDLAYTYDPIGNVLAVVDGAQQTIYFDNSVVTPSAHYVYDAMYRLVHAEGREHLPAQALDWNDAPRVQQADRGDGQAMQLYTQDFGYDEVGNILSVIHTANQGGWNRPYHYATDSNQLQWTDVATNQYAYDPHGNMTAMPHLASLGWNDRDQLAQVDLGGGGTAYYVYDAAGERTRKVIVRQGGAIEERFYLGGYEVYRERDAGGIRLERQSLHVMDDKRRIALAETLVRDRDGDVTAAPLVRLQLGNLLGSAVLELEPSGALISYEEYYPFGSTAYEAGPGASDVPRKRYRYVGKERDDESGFYFCGARYYASWLGRWTAADPIGVKDGVNVYAYVANNPINRTDPTGTENVPTEMYDPDVMNKTDPQLYRYMKAMEEPARALFIANTAGMFKVRATAMADKYHMPHGDPVIHATPPPKDPEKKSNEHAFNPFKNLSGLPDDFKAVPGLLDFQPDLDREIAKHNVPEVATDPEKARLLAIAIANKSVGALETPEETPVHGIVHDPLRGYDYARAHDLGPTSEVGSAESVMSQMQANPNLVFPFNIIPKGADPSTPGVRAGVYIKMGAELDLVGPQTTLFSKDASWGMAKVLGADVHNGVKVVEVTPTSFMFMTDKTHFDGPDAPIRFSTYESAGHTYFLQRGFAPNANVVSGTLAPPITELPGVGPWERQASNLKDLTRNGGVGGAGAY